MVILGISPKGWVCVCVRACVYVVVGMDIFWSYLLSIYKRKNISNICIRVENTEARVGIK